MSRELAGGLGGVGRWGRDHISLRTAGICNVHPLRPYAAGWAYSNKANIWVTDVGSRKNAYGGAYERALRLCSMWLRANRFSDACYHCRLKAPCQASNCDQKASLKIPRG